MKKSQPSHRDCASFGNPVFRTQLGKNFPTDNVRRVNIALCVANGYVLNDGASTAVDRVRANHSVILRDHGVHFADDLAGIISDQHLAILRFETFALRSRTQTAQSRVDTTDRGEDQDKTRGVGPHCRLLLYQCIDPPAAGRMRYGHPAAKAAFQNCQHSHHLAMDDQEVEA